MTTPPAGPTATCPNGRSVVLSSRSIFPDDIQRLVSRHALQMRIDDSFQPVQVLFFQCLDSDNQLVRLDTHDAGTFTKPNPALLFAQIGRASCRERGGQSSMDSTAGTNNTENTIRVT